jgi:hypothetical protein
MDARLLTPLQHAQLCRHDAINNGFAGSTGLDNRNTGLESR